MQLLHTRFSTRFYHLQMSTLRYCSSYLLIDDTNLSAWKLKLIYSSMNAVKCVGYRFCSFLGFRSEISVIRTSSIFVALWFLYMSSILITSH
jgi:hypothetical protein